jgi:hypothetical protein
MKEVELDPKFGSQAGSCTPPIWLFPKRDSLHPHHGSVGLKTEPHKNS